MPSLPTKPLAPLYLLHGDAPLLIIEAGDEIRNAARQQGFSEHEVLIADSGFNWSSLSQASANYSLFGSAKLIDLRIPTGKPGREGGEALQAYAKSLSADTVTLITLPEIDWQTRKTVWFKQLAAAGLTLEFNTPPLNKMPQWIAQRLAAQNQSTSQEALIFFTEQVEGNLLAAHQEILKLALIHPPGRLELEQIRDAILSVARYDIDALREALLNADAARCICLLEGLKNEGIAPPLILWAISNELRTLALFRDGLDKNQALPSLFKTLRVFDNKRKQALQQALPRHRGGTLKSALLHAARIDRLIKGLGKGDIWDEMRRLLLRITHQH